MTDNLSFSWAVANKDNDPLASFIYLFCPQSTPTFPTKREDWLHSLQSAIIGKQIEIATAIENKYKPEKENINQQEESDILAAAIRLKYQGHNNKEISSILNVSDRTIRRWLRNIPDEQTLDKDGRLILSKKEAATHGVEQDYNGITKKDIPY